MVPSAVDRDIFSTDSAIHQTSHGLDIQNHLLPEPVLLSLIIDLGRHTVLQNPSFSIPSTRLLQESASIKSTALDRIDCYRVRSVQISCKIAIS